MSKKKKKNFEFDSDDFLKEKKKSKKDMKKSFQDAVKEVEAAQMRIYEADKKSVKGKDRRNINQKQYQFYTDMESIKTRKTLAAEWEKNNFLDRMQEILKESIPIIRGLARIIAGLIISFLSIEAIKTNINPNTLSKMKILFDVAMAV